MPDRSGPPMHSYGRAARLRVALAEQAAEIADSARGMVPTYADSFASGGEFVEMAAALATSAREMLSLAVAYERRRGTSWETIGEALGISRQAAHERHAEADKQLDDEMVKCWLLDEEPWRPRLPAGAADPAGTAERLDRWVSIHMENTDPLAHRDPGDPEHAQPVSGNLAPMDHLEHSVMVAAAARLIAEQIGEHGLNDPGTRELELGLARRKAELYGWMLADETADPGRTGTSADQLRDLLTDTRARLGEMENRGRLP